MFYFVTYRQFDHYNNNINMICVHLFECLDLGYFCRLAKRKAVALGTAFAISQTLFYCAFAAAFYAGAYMIHRGEVGLRLYTCLI